MTRLHAAILGFGAGLATAALGWDFRPFLNEMRTAFAPEITFAPEIVITPDTDFAAEVRAIHRLLNEKLQELEPS